MQVPERVLNDEQLQASFAALPPELGEALVLLGVRVQGSGVDELQMLGRGLILMQQQRVIQQQHHLDGVVRAMRLVVNVSCTLQAAPFVRSQPVDGR